MGEELSETEMRQLAEAFKELGVKPKTTSAKELKLWVINYANWTTPRISQGDMPDAFDAGGATSSLQHSSTTYTHQPPKLPVFSGDKKSDTSYDLWRYEVQCLMKDDVRATTILQSIRRSLRGNAARVLMRLGTEASIENILHRFDSVYGTVDDNENLLSQFYSASQGGNEDVSEWSCRLEDLLNKVIQNGEITPTNADQMLKNMFWNGLSENLKDITGYIFRECSNVDELRRAVRKVEQDKLRKGSIKKTNIHQTVTNTSNVQMDELKAMIQKMDAKMNQMKEDIDDVRKKYDYQGQGQQYRHHKDKRRGQTQENESDKEIICYRCGQVGHVKSGCRVRLDHKKDLNSSRPASRRGR